MNRDTGGGFESGQAPKSLKEIDDRLDVLDEIVDTFGKNHPKAVNALMERAGLLQERSSAEQMEQRRTQSAPTEQQRQPVLPPEQKQVMEKREDLNAVLVKEMSTLVSSGFTRPEIKLALARLRDPKNVERFVGDKVGVEFFTQDMKTDYKARQLVEDALERLYTSANGESYYQEAA